MNMVTSGLACSATSETSTGFVFFSLTFGILNDFEVSFCLMKKKTLKRFEERLRENDLLF